MIISYYIKIKIKFFRIKRIYLPLSNILSNIVDNFIKDFKVLLVNFFILKKEKFSIEIREGLNNIQSIQSN